MAKQTDKPSASADTVTRVGKAPFAWAVFLFIIMFVLVFDLGLKAWCFGAHEWDFAQLGPGPVIVRTAEAGGPEVLVHWPTQKDDWVPAHKVGLTPDPSLVPRHEPIVLVPSVLNLQLTLNTGAVFGMGQGGRPFFIVVSVLATGIILVLLYRSPRGAWFYQAALALILGGALGNLYDRVRFSAVRDMLHLFPDTDLPFGWNWPGGSTGIFPYIFNPADAALVCGVCMVLVISWVSEAKQSKKAKQAKRESA